uniref:Uncharacterized protein n=1 Tax=Oncorhynchus mykiss TaxID=8022 RepID=A0A8C7RV53_ONCMY
TQEVAFVPEPLPFLLGALQVKQLIEGGASVNMVTVDNITPLHDACIQGHPNFARLLLDAWAQVDVRTIHGSAPLCNACAAGSLEYWGNSNADIVRLMIAHGVLLEAFDLQFGTPLHAACARSMWTVPGCCSKQVRMGTKRKTLSQATAVIISMALYHTVFMYTFYIQVFVMLGGHWKFIHKSATKMCFLFRCQELWRLLLGTRSGDRRSTGHISTYHQLHFLRHEGC